MPPPCSSSETRIRKSKVPLIELRSSAIFQPPLQFLCLEKSAFQSFYLTSVGILSCLKDIFNLTLGEHVSPYTLWLIHHSYLSHSLVSSYVCHLLSLRRHLNYCQGFVPLFFSIPLLFSFMQNKPISRQTPQQQQCI